MTWIQTSTGVRFEYMAPTAAMVTLFDVSHALSRLCRFNGAVRGFWSVASHSVLVADVAADMAKARGLDEIEAGYRGLLHDAVEAYVGDMPRPLKDLLPPYKEVENRCERAVRAYFGIDKQDDAIDQIIKKADLILLATEARDFLPRYADKYLHGVEPMKKKLRSTPIEIAEGNFMSAFSYWSQNRPREERDRLQGASA